MLVLLFSPVFSSAAGLPPCRSLCPSDAAAELPDALGAGAKAPLIALCTVSSDALALRKKRPSS